MELKYVMPTKIIMGSDCVKHNADQLKPLGKRALIVTGARSAKENGSLQDVLFALESNGQSYDIFDKVMTNPTVSCVYEGASFARSSSSEFIIAIGGGSPIDAAKGIALLACQSIAEEDLFSGIYGEAVLPIVCIPTTAGTGSEVTQYAILTNDRVETKTSIATPLLFPRLTFLDARYLQSLSTTVTINTALDALSHSIEGMLSSRASVMTDMHALQSISLISSCFESLSSGGLSLMQREKLLFASTLAGIVIANTGTTAVHALGYSLTYFRNIDHGRANALLLGEFLKCIYKTKPALVEKVLGAMHLDTVASFSLLISSLLGEKEKFTEEELVSYAKKAMQAKNIANTIVSPTEEELLLILRTSLLQDSNSDLKSNRHYSIPFVSLEDYVPVRNFRTIPARLRYVSAGPSEIYVEIEVSPSFSKQLGYEVPWDGKLFGFVHDNEHLQKIFCGDLARDYKNRHMYLNDWGTKFLLTFENGEKDAELSRFVSAEEVQNLLTNCRMVKD